MDRYDQQRSVVDEFRKAVDQSSFVLRSNPELIFPQLYNRLQRKFEENIRIEEKLELEHDRYKKPWLRLTHKPPESTNLIRTFSGHKGQVDKCVFTPDGKRILSVSVDDVMKLWDPDTSEELLSWYASFLWLLRLSPNGKYVVINENGAPYSLTLWNVEKGKKIASLRGHKEYINDCAFSPDGSRIASISEDKILKLWSSETFEEIATLEVQRLDSYSPWVGGASPHAFSPDGRQIAFAIKGNLLKVLDIETGADILELKGHNDSILTCAFSPDGNQILSASEDKTLKLWDPLTGKELATLKGHSGSVRSCAFSPDGRRILSECFRKVSAKAKPAKNSNGVDSYETREVMLWDAHAGEIIATLKGFDSQIKDGAFSPDSKRIASVFRVSSLKLWDAENGKNLGTMEGHSGDVRDYNFSPDGRFILFTTDNNTFRLYETEKGDELAQSDRQTGEIISFAFTPDSRRIISSAYTERKVPFDCVNRIWDTEPYKEIYTLTEYGEFLGFSPDGRMSVFLGKSNTLFLWDTVQSQEIATLEDPHHYVYAYAFSPDNKTILSVSSRRYYIRVPPLGHEWTIKLWSSENGKELAVLKGLTGKAKTCMFSADGRQVIVIDQNSQHYRFTIENLASSPIIVTPFKISDVIYFYCQYCQSSNPITDASMGQEVLCSSCHQKLKLNSFAIPGYLTRPWWKSWYDEGSFK